MLIKLHCNLIWIVAKSESLKLGRDQYFTYMDVFDKGHVKTVFFLGLFYTANKLQRDEIQSKSIRLTVSD